MEQIILPEPVARLLDALEKNGFMTYAVGGCVRDSLLGRQPSDWDLCTAALSQQVLELFGEDALPTGIRHGTVTVKSGDMLCEITTFRTEGPYSDHRRPDWVRYTPNVTDDLARRDFTVNAMAWHPSRGLFDPFGGREDLHRRVLRCVGRAKERFEEDALRVLRALRFSAVLGFSIEDETAQALRAAAPDLGRVAAERSLPELERMLGVPAGARLLCENPEVAAALLPELLPVIRRPRSEQWHGVVDALLRLSALSLPEETDDRFLLCCVLLLSELPIEKAKEALRRLRLDSSRQREILRILEQAAAPVAVQRAELCRLLYRLGPQTVRRLLCLWRAMGGREAELTAAQKALDQLLDEGACFSLSSLAVDGKDLIARGVKPGPQVGRWLQKLLFLVMDEKVKNERQALLTALDALLLENAGC